MLGTNFLDTEAAFNSDCVCMSEVMICPVGRDHIEQVARELPNVPLRLIQILSERMDHLEGQLELSNAPVSLRLGQTFAWLAHRFSVPDLSHWRDLPMDIKQEDLAAICGTTRVTVTHILGELREMGLVEGTRGRYRVNLTALDTWLEASEQELQE